MRQENVTFEASFGYMSFQASLGYKVRPYLKQTDKKSVAEWSVPHPPAGPGLWHFPADVAEFLPPRISKHLSVETLLSFFAFFWRRSLYNPVSPATHSLVQASLEPPWSVEIKVMCHHGQLGTLQYRAQLSLKPEFGVRPWLISSILANGKFPSLSFLPHRPLAWEGLQIVAN